MWECGPTSTVKTACKAYEKPPPEKQVFSEERTILVTRRNAVMAAQSLCPYPDSTVFLALSEAQIGLFFSNYHGDNGTIMPKHHKRWICFNIATKLIRKCIHDRAHRVSRLFGLAAGSLGFVVADPLISSLQYAREDPHQASEAAYHEIGVKTTINQALTTLVAKGEVASVSAYCARSMSWPCQIASS